MPVHKEMFRQALLNLLLNAEQAMLAANGHGTLTVRTRKQEGVIRVSFHDEGPGMPPETLRRIFDPFFTTKDTGEGTGLGLTISYGIIDDHGGRIWAESQPNRGATFIIELPIVQGQAVTVNPLFKVAASVFVVSVTLRTPVAAAGSTFSTAVEAVGERTVREATVIPAPKLAVVVPWTKCVFWPVMATERFCWPCWPELSCLRDHRSPSRH